MNLDDLLSRIHIAQPCPAQWAEMQGDDASRFCQQCEKNVYNFAEMSTEEIAALLQREAKVCGRLYRRADGTIMTRDCKPSRNPMHAGWSAAWKGLAASAIGASVLSGCTPSQDPHPPVSTEVPSTPAAQPSDTPPQPQTPSATPPETTTHHTGFDPKLISTEGPLMGRVLMGDVCIEPAEVPVEEKKDSQER